MVRAENREADLWVKQVVLEIKNEYRELIYPISLLQFEECKTDGLQDGFATDGTTVYYHSEYILEYRKEELKRQLLHIVLHGLLGHFEIKDEYEYKAYRDFMMDIQVEYVLRQMKQENMYESKSSWQKLDEYVSGDYSMSIYRRLCEDVIPTIWLEYYYRSLQVDNHEIWDQGENESKAIKLWSKIRGELLGERDKEEWSTGGVDEIIGAVAGKGGAAEENVFKIDKGRGVLYKELLEELICTREKDREEPDSIDWMFYQYGMALYGDVPLIEPMEAPKCTVNLIVIAVDVSGSCLNNNQMRIFFGETYECLQRLKERFKETEVLLLQCDDAIRREQRIKLREWNDNPEDVLVYGGGRTSFVPVFDRLAVLEQSGNKIDALLYLTDGIGMYPKVKPNYPVHFILMNTHEEYREIPEWINKVSLQ